MLEDDFDAQLGRMTVPPPARDGYMTSAMVRVCDVMILPPFPNMMVPGGMSHIMADDTRELHLIDCRVCCCNFRQQGNEH
jgi:hypothetical protein